MRVQLVQGPEGAPNFCFGLYYARTTCPDCKRKWARCECGNSECVEFVQSDWDYAGLASRLGWEACECGATDGTVDCPHKKRSDMLSAAYEFLAERDGHIFELEDHYA